MFASEDSRGFQRWVGGSGEEEEEGAEEEELEVESGGDDQGVGVVGEEEEVRIKMRREEEQVELDETIERWLVEERNADKEGNERVRYVSYSVILATRVDSGRSVVVGEKEKRTLPLFLSLDFHCFGETTLNGHTELDHQH